MTLGLSRMMQPIYVFCFLRFKDFYGDCLDLVFIKNRNPSFSNAIQSVFLDIYHEHYAYLLRKNMNPQINKNND